MVNQEHTAVRVCRQMMMASDKDCFQVIQDAERGNKVIEHGVKQ